MSESNPIQIRPRFKVRTSKSQAEIEAMINGFLKTEGCICKGKINHGFGTITIPKVEQHYWSPQLTKTIAQIIRFFNPVRDGFLMDEVGAPRTRKA